MKWSGERISIPCVDAICGLSLVLVSSLLWQVFLRVLWCFSLLKSQHFQIPIPPGMVPLNYYLFYYLCSIFHPLYTQGQMKSFYWIMSDCVNLSIKYILYRFIHVLQHWTIFRKNCHNLSTVNTMSTLQPGKSNSCVTSLTAKNCHDSLNGNCENLPKFSKLRWLRPSGQDTIMKAAVNSDSL